MGSVQNHNDQLAALMARAAWSGQDLAAAINIVGREASLALRYSRSSVAQWLTGMHPRPPVPHILAEALSRQFGHPISAGEAGFGEDGLEANEQEPIPADTLLTLAIATDPRRLSTSPHRIYRLAELSVPAVSGTLETAWHPAPSASRQSPLQVDRHAVDTAVEMLRLFADADAATGAGHLRPALSLYLANNIAPSLHASSPDIRAELLRVTAWLTHLCGLMCYDDELHGFAQRYLRLAMRLSAETGGTGPQALVLRAMSGQALSLGYRGHALSLAERAVDVADPALPPQGRASLLAQLAMARAGTGDRRGAMAAIDTAQSHLLQSTAEAGLVDAHYALGAYHESALAHQRGLTLALLGERSSAITALQYSIRHRPELERRARAITLTRLAGLQLRQGHLDQAVDTWHHFLDDYPTINSGRARTALTLLPNQLRPHKRVPAANALLARAISLQQLPHVIRGPRMVSAIPPQDAEIRPRHPVQARWDRPFTTFCDGCGAPVSASAAERRRRYCGPACRQRAYRARKTTRTSE